MSFERLADVVDTPQVNEDDKSKIPLPPIHGDVKFENVGFQFAPNKPEVLKRIDLDIPQEHSLELSARVAVARAH